MKQDHSAFYKRYTHNDQVIYLVTNAVVGRLKYHTVRTMYSNLDVKMDKATFEWTLNHWAWTQIEEAEYLLSKIT